MKKGDASKCRRFGFCVTLNLDVEGHPHEKESVSVKECQEGEDF